MCQRRGYGDEELHQQPRGAGELRGGLDAEHGLGHEATQGGDRGGAALERAKWKRPQLRQQRLRTVHAAAAAAAAWG